MPRQGRIVPDYAEHRLSGPPFAVDPSRIGVIRVPLDTALSNKEFAIGAHTLLWAYNYSSLNAEATVRLAAQTSAPVTYKPGMLISGFKAEAFYVTCSAQSGEWIEFLYLREGEGNVSLQNPSIEFQNVSLSSPDTLETTADDTVAATSSAQVLAANSDRREAIVQNLDSSDSVRVGDSNVGASRGLRLGPGDSVVLTTTAAIHVHNPNGSGVAVSLVEISK